MKLHNNWGSIVLLFLENIYFQSKSQSLPRNINPPSSNNKNTSLLRFHSQNTKRKRPHSMLKFEKTTTPPQKCRFLEEDEFEKNSYMNFKV